MKTSVIILLFALLSKSSSAQSYIKLTLNNKLVGKAVVPDQAPITFEVPINKYKNIKSLIVEYILKEPMDVYKKNIEIAGDNDVMIAGTNEESLKPLRLAVSSNSLLKKIYHQKTLKLYIILNPRNPMMSMPSRKNLLAEVHFK